MKHISFLTIFLITNIAFLFLYMNNHMLFIKQSFAKQKQEHLRNELLEKKQQLVHQLHIVQSREHIKNFAQEKLHMRPVSLSQIRQLPKEPSDTIK